MDDEMLHAIAKSKPVRLAAEAWREREGEMDTIWNAGCNGVRTYLDGGELAAWIRAREPGVSREYSQKLAGRTIDAMIDIANGRLHTQLKNRRKDGLRY